MGLNSGKKWQKINAVRQCVAGGGEFPATPTEKINFRKPTLSRRNLP